MRLNDEESAAFAAAVRAAAGRADLLLAIDCIYEQAQDAIDLRQPRCDASGRCCRFEEYGHRLFITTAEMAAFLASNPILSATGPGCPYQAARLCRVHATRPFGCRIFFCDPSADQWQSLQYERLHEQIKALHESLDVPYFYVEWREALGCVAGLSRSTRTTFPTP